MEHGGRTVLARDHALAGAEAHRGRPLNKIVRPHSMDDLKKIFGNDYPNSVTVLGRRLPLTRERRFTRHYWSEEERHASEVSKFHDGSATMSFDQFAKEWPQWSEEDRRDFVHACNGLCGQGDFADILRFLMNQEDSDIWRAIALQVGSFLPQAEAFDLLVHALDRTESHTANITQGISATRDPRAIATLQQHLETLWNHPNLWDDDRFTNWHAFDAICCIEHLLQLGLHPAEYAERARELSNHVCVGTRESCGTFLSRYYDWIPQPNLGRLGL